MALTFLGRTGKPEQTPEPPRHPYMPQTSASGAVAARRVAADAAEVTTDDLQAALTRLIEQSGDAPAAPAPAPAALPAPASASASAASAAQLPPARRASQAQAQAHPPAQQTLAPAAQAEPAGDDHLLEEVQAVLSRLEANRERPSTDALLNQIDALAANIERQNGELRAQRATIARLQAESTRANAENEKLRRMMKSLLAAVDADGKRVSDSLERAERRLRDLVPTAAEQPPAQPLRQAQRAKADPAG